MQPLTLFRNRYHLIVSSVSKTLAMPNFPGNLVHAANPTSKGSRVECEKRAANDATVFRKAAWRKTRTRLQRMHNVSKRHIGEYQKKRKKEKKNGERKRDIVSQQQTVMGVQSLLGLNTRPCTREKGKSAEWNWSVCVCVGVKHWKKEKRKREACAFGGCETRERAKDGGRTGESDGIGEHEWWCDRVKFHVLTFASSISTGAVFVILRHTRKETRFNEGLGAPWSSRESCDNEFST